MRDILFWAATVEGVGLASLPLLRAFFGNRRDAALLSRPVGLAIVAWLGWLLSLAAGFYRGTLFLALAAVALTSFLLYRKRKKSGAPSAVFDGQRFWGPEEKRAAVLFWASAGVFLAIRAAVPEILAQEKFMDLAMLNSLTRNPAMPPADPWMAGKSINYYYWGYLLAAALTKISGVSTFVSYNLAVATFAGYSFVAAVSLAMRLASGSLTAGLAAGGAAVFAGNLQGAFDALRAPFAKDFNYFHASRVIGGDATINEFPFFTFFHADLHPHLLAFPFFIAAFVLAHRFIEAKPAPRTAEGENPWRTQMRTWASALLLALIAGTAFAANKWNLPTMGILLVLACILRTTQGRRVPTIRQATIGALLGPLLFLVAFELFFFYEASYELEQPEILKTTLKSELLEFFAFWGLLLLASLAVLWPKRSREESARRLETLFVAAAAAGSFFAALAVHRVALLPLLFLSALAVRVAWTALTKEQDADLFYCALLFLLALAMIAGCELVYFKDNYGAKAQRMNTIFKFYHQAWPLFGISIAVFAVRAWPGLKHLRRGTLAFCSVLALFYPLCVAGSRFRQREGSFTLDGRPALTRRSPEDASAIAWLEKNAPWGSVVLEATGDPYSEFARISTHTGIPTLMGWANHEGLWRRSDQHDDPEVAQRANAVRAFFSGNARAAWYTLTRYHVTHVVLGALELTSYPKAIEIETYPFLEPAHTAGETTVFRVALPPAAPAAGRSRR